MQLRDYDLSRLGDYKLSQSVSGRAFEFEGRDYWALNQNMYGAFMTMDARWWEAFLQNPSAYVAMLEQLVSNRFFVPKHTNEAILYHTRRQELVNRFTEMSSHSVLTRRCNLACKYCILDAEPKRMDRNTAMLVDLAWTTMIKKKKPVRVRDVYSGGEVMLNLPVLLESAARRFFFCAGSGIDYRFWIISNGTLLTPEAVSRMKEVGLEGIRVSIAGPSWIHSPLRPFRKAGSRSTYDVILKNLEAISGQIRIISETQYDAGSDDYLQVPRMLEDFQKRSIGIENVHFTPILPKRGRCEFQCGLGDPEKLLFLMREAEKLGYLQFHKAQPNGCMSDYRSGMVFDTDGSYLSCPSVQSGEFTYGHAARGIDDLARSQIIERQFSDYCLSECDLLALCNGGCRLNSLSSGRSFNGIDCQYPAMRLILDEHMMRKAIAAIKAQHEKAA